MLNKTYTATILLLSLFSSSAWSNGFYVGAGLGPEADNFKQSATIIHATDTNVKDTNHFSAIGVFGTLFGGYAWNCRQLYLAGEANINRNTGTRDSSNYEFIHRTFANTTYKVPYSYGISVLPGYLLTRSTLFYGRLGYSNGNFQISTGDVSLANINRNLSGVRFGLGMMQSIGCNLSVRMEYSQVNYNSTSFATINNDTVKSTKITPTTQQVEFGLVYSFC